MKNILLSVLLFLCAWWLCVLSLVTAALLLCPYPVAQVAILAGCGAAIIGLSVQIILLYRRNA